MSPSTLKRRRRHRPLLALNTGWQSRVWKSTSNPERFHVNDDRHDEGLPEDNGARCEVGICVQQRPVRLRRRSESELPGPSRCFDHAVSLVGYYDDADRPYPADTGSSRIAGTPDIIADYGIRLLSSPMATLKTTTTLQPYRRPSITPVRWRR